MVMVLAIPVGAQTDYRNPCPALQALTAFDLDNPHIEPNQVALVHDLAQQAEQYLAHERPSIALQRRVQLLAHFTDVSAGKSLTWVDLAQSKDPGVVFLRDTLRWPAPPGLVFIRSYDSLDDMPSFVRSGFQRSNTQGVTLGCRYIALKRRWDRVNQSLPSPFDKRILSHELTHAYINSTLGPRRHQLPLWFHEAMAAYASGTGNLEHDIDVSLGPGGIETTSYEDPVDYQTYALVFRYLRHHWGRKPFHHCLRECLLQASVEPLFKQAQVRNYQFLVIDARYWQNRQQRLRFWIALGVLLVVMTWCWWHLPRHGAEEEKPTSEPSEEVR